MPHLFAALQCNEAFFEAWKSDDIAYANVDGMKQLVGFCVIMPGYSGKNGRDPLQTRFGKLLKDNGDGTFSMLRQTRNLEIISEQRTYIWGIVQAAGGMWYISPEQTKALLRGFLSIEVPASVPAASSAGSGRIKL